MSDEVTMRAAGVEDIAALARFRYDFRTRNSPANEDRDAFLERCGEWMRGRLNDGTWFCWIAERGGLPLGNLWLKLIEKIPNPTHETEYHAYITNFYVLEEARGQGVGSKLLTLALEWCRERRLHAVILWPSDRSRPLYERNGFAVRDDLLELIVTEKGSGSRQ